MHSNTAWFATLTALRAVSIAAAALSQPASPPVQVDERSPDILPAASHFILQLLAILTVTMCLGEISTTETVAISSPCTRSATSPITNAPLASDSANTPHKPTPTSVDNNGNLSISETAGSKQRCGECKSVTIEAHPETATKSCTTETCLQGMEPSVIPAVIESISEHNLTSYSTAPCSGTSNMHNATSTRTRLPTPPTYFDDTNTSSASNAVPRHGYSALSLILVIGMGIIVWVTNGSEL